MSIVESNHYNIVIFIVIFVFSIILNFLMKKFQILVDKKESYSHKSFIGNIEITPLSGGLIFFSTLIFFLPNNLLLFKVIISLIFLNGYLSDINLLKNPTKRILFQTFVILVYLLISENFISSIRIDFFDNLLNIFPINLLFTLFCILILINGTNFIDGVNTSVAGYYLIVLLNVFYLASTKNLNLDFTLVFLSMIALIVIYMFNFFGKSYLGDNGSYLISFVIGITLINFSNNNLLVSPYYIIALLWYPAFENLFSILRKIFLKKSPSSPDNDHLHQLIFLYLNKIFKIKKNTSNTMTGVLISLYHLIFLLVIFENFSHTKILVYFILANIFFYNLLYFVLKKNLKAYNNG